MSIKSELKSLVSYASHDGTDLDPEWVYFVAEFDGRLGYIKIGRAFTYTNIPNRLQYHQTGNPRRLVFLGTVKLYLGAESDIHKILDQYLAFRGIPGSVEWFTPECSRYIAYLFDLCGQSGMEIDTGNLLRMTRESPKCAKTPLKDIEIVTENDQFFDDSIPCSNEV